MTHVLLQALTFRDPGDEAAVVAVLQEAMTLPEVEGGWAGRPVQGPALIWRATFADEPAYRRWRASDFWRGAAAGILESRVSRRDSVFYRSAIGRSRQDKGRSIWRGLIFATVPEASRQEVGALETALLAMPTHIPEIRAHRLSRVLESIGTCGWTHVWEQEFDSIDGLRGPYLHHPVHWGHVDAWFDVECPQWIVDPRLIHCFVEEQAAIRV